MSPNGNFHVTSQFYLRKSGDDMKRNLFVINIFVDCSKTKIPLDGFDLKSFFLNEKHSVEKNFGDETIGQGSPILGNTDF